MSSDAPVSKPAPVHARAGSSSEPPVAVVRQVSQTYRNVWRKFESWCAQNETSPSSGMEALEKYIAYLLENNRPLKTVRLYIGAICAIAEETGISLHKNDPKIEELLVPFVERHRQDKPRSYRGRVIGRAGAEEPDREAARAGFRFVIETIMGRGGNRAERVRDRALLLLWLTAGLTPAELGAVTLEHVAPSPANGLLLYIHRPQRKLNPVSVSYWPYKPDALDCTALAVLEWLVYRWQSGAVVGTAGVPLFVDAGTGEGMSEAMTMEVIRNSLGVLGLPELPRLEPASLKAEMTAAGMPVSVQEPVVGFTGYTDARSAFRINEYLWELDSGLNSDFVAL